MPPIRQMIVGVLITMLAAFGMIFFIGGYETSNGLALNATIASNYNAITANPSAPAAGIFCSSQNGACLSSLASQVNNTGTSLQSYSTNPLGSLINTVSVVAGYLFEIGAFFGLLSTFISTPLSLFMPVGFAQLIGNITLIIIFVMGLLSGIFLVPM